MDITNVLSERDRFKKHKSSTLKNNIKVLNKMSKIVVKNRRDLTQRKCSKPELRINNNFDDIIELQKIQMKKSKSYKKFEIPDIII